MRIRYLRLIQQNPFIGVKFQHVRVLHLRTQSRRFERDSCDGQQFSRVAPFHAQRALQAGVDVNGSYVVERRKEIDVAVLEGDG